MKRTVLFAQGEITAYLVSEMPKGLVPHTEADSKGRPIISHSEKGHHHILGAATMVLERMDRDVPEGMRILYALLDQPTQLMQDAPNAHEAHDLLPGIVEFRISREFDSFSEQIRQVAD